MTIDVPAHSEKLLQQPAHVAAKADDPFAAALRGFGPVGIVAMIAILAGNMIVVPLSGILVLLWAWRSGTPWRELGYVKPRNWVLTIGGGVVFGIAFKILMKVLVMPLLGAEPVNQAFHYLVGNRAALPGILYAVIAGAGFGEETVFRGYLFERMGKLFGSSPLAKTAIVLLTSVWFAVLHYPLQGIPGVEQALIVGLVYGAIFVMSGQILMLMIAHAAFDLTAVAIIYWDLETSVAHFIFK